MPEPAPDKELAVLFKSGVDRSWTVKEGVLNESTEDGRACWKFVGRRVGTTGPFVPVTVFRDGIDSYTFS